MTRRDGLYRDRDGELVAAPPSRGHLTILPDVREPEACPEGCDNGWLGSSTLPEPCPSCKPETVRRLQQQREKCRVCRTRLHPGLVEAGYRTHPSCDPYEAPHGA